MRNQPAGGWKGHSLRLEGLGRFVAHYGNLLLGEEAVVGSPVAGHCSWVGAGTGLDLVVAQIAVAEEGIVPDLAVGVGSFAGKANDLAEDTVPEVDIDLAVGIGLAEDTVLEEDKALAEADDILVLEMLMPFSHKVF